MTNADDSPPSGSDDGNNRNGRSDNGEESASSREQADTEQPPGIAGSNADADDDSDGGLHVPSPGELDEGDTSDADDHNQAEDPSNPKRSDRKIRRTETRRGGYAAAGSDADVSPLNSDGDDAGEGDTKRPGDETPLESDDPFDISDDLFAGDDIFEDGAFEEARERDQQPGEEFAEEESHDYDVGPTRVSESFDDDSHDDGDDPSSPSTTDASSGLESLAREMEEAEASGDLHDEPALEMDATIDESAFQTDDYEKTNVSQPDFEFDEDEEDEQPAAGPEMSGAISGETEAADPGSHPGARPGSRPGDSSVPSNVSEHSEPRYSSAPSSRPERPDNPPPPEETGRGGQSGRSSSSPRYEETEGARGEPNDEFAEQETELFDSPFESEPIYPRLTVLEGPSSGQEYLLKNLRNSVGRSTKNAVVVPDETMSRQHMEVIQNPDDSYSIRDLQSVNGTFLNGTRIEEADLFHGDRVEAGQTTFQFVIPGQTPQREERNRHVVTAESKDEQTAPSRDASPAAPPSSGSRDDLTVWLNRIIIGASILMVPLAGVFIYLTLYGPTAPSPAERKRINAARKAYLQGVEAVKKRNWDAARKRFRRAEKIDAGLPEIEAQLERIEMEKKARSALQKARSLLKKDQTERAVEHAESVPEQSVYYEDAREILRRQHRKKRIASLYERASEHYEKDQNQKALATIQRILSTVPNHDEALNLRRRILATTDADLKKAKKRAEQKAEKRREQERKEQEREHEASDERSKQARATDQSHDESGSSWLLDDDSDEHADDNATGAGGGGVTDVNFTKGFALYRHENFDAAVSHFRNAADEGSGVIEKRARKAARSIEAFRTAYRNGKTALSNGSYKRAVDQFRKALRNDKEVSSEGYFQEKLDKRIADAQARRGLKLFGKDKFSEAYRKLEDASHFDESHPKVRDLQRKLEEKATSLYIQAKAKQKTNPGKAASLCRSIMSIVPESNETYQKAQDLLDDI